MFETLSLIVLCLVLLILLPVLLVISGVRFLFELPVRELLNDIGYTRKERWRNADPLMRERIVRLECAWRAIGRVAGAGALIVGAFNIGSPALAAMWAVAAWRVVKPIKQEMRDACSYRATGTKDEPPYSW
jgi:hypothetical protein